MNGIVNIVIKVLQKRNYIIEDLPSSDEFGRFRMIVRNRKNKRLFVKSTIGKSTYGYKSLQKEALLYSHIRRKLQRDPVKYKGYKLSVPNVHSIIEENGVICLITDFIDGAYLINQSDKNQADILIYTYNMVTRLNLDKKSTIKFTFKKYNIRDLIIQIPGRCVRAILLHPQNALRLILVAIKVLPLIKSRNLKKGFVHSDINASNIIMVGKDIYLMDWEDAGWGIKLYNGIAPLCTHWTNRVIRLRLLNFLKKLEDNEAIFSLIAFRTLMLFNQKITSKNVKYARDVALLNSL
ncbi:phosphotransferase [Candidatus Roizmanbacteria bacterium]|nr:phosphotransferase [Candidatus Roizmanbacteria bacterium]